MGSYLDAKNDKALVDVVKALARLVEDHGLTTLEIAEGDTRLRLERKLPLNQTQPVVFTPNSQPVGQFGTKSVADASALGSQDDEDQGIDFNKLTLVPSPLVGVFYSAPSPDSDPFVAIGNKVKKGDVLCIVESMKLMNEVTAEQDGEIVDICVKNGDIVEFEQVLFKMF